jgi:hypothetical protein
MRSMPGAYFIDRVTIHAGDLVILFRFAYRTKPLERSCRNARYLAEDGGPTVISASCSEPSPI